MKFSPLQRRGPRRTIHLLSPEERLVTRLETASCRACPANSSGRRKPHVFNRGHNSETVFLDDLDRQNFLALVARSRQRFGVRLYHYCLMSNHFHLVLQLDDPRRLSSLVAGLLRSYVHRFHRRYGFVGHLWQGRFHSLVIQRDAYLLSCGRYVERNPVKAGLAAEPWDYRWSSCRASALGETDALVDESPCYRDLAALAGRRQHLWRQFLLSDDPREPAIRRGAGVLGDGPFCERLDAVHGRRVRRRRGRPAKHPASERIST